MRPFFLRLALAFVWLIPLTLQLSGAGFSILEQSAAGLGRSLAGMTAEIEDPGSVFFNPATGAWHQRPTLMVGSHFLLGDVGFHDRGSTFSGDQDENITSLAMVPNLYYVHPLSDGITLNLGISATSGTSTTYEDDWQGRYFAIKTEVSVIEISPSLSWKINENWAVGAGFIAQYAEATMSQAIAFDQTTFNRAYDGQLKLEGDSWAFGYSLGVLYRPFESTRIGLGYRSKLSHDLSMKARLRIPKTVAPLFGGVTRITEDASCALDLPASINLGIQQDLNEKWTVMFDVAWTKWSDMEELKVKFDRPILGIKESSEEMKWRDNWRFALGTQYQLNEKWTLRTGIAFDTTPVRNKYLRVAKLPDANRFWLSFGAGYQFSEQLRLDAAFTHLFFYRCDIEQANEQGYRLSGDFSGYMNIYSLALNYQF
ncbi:MAG: transporter [Lentisphaerae bacterium]|nr:transporter [Lentisphaerota bacterium]